MYWLEMIGAESLYQYLGRWKSPAVLEELRSGWWVTDCLLRHGCGIVAGPKTLLKKIRFASFADI